MIKMSQIHPALENIKWLIGTWSSVNAVGQYTTINKFTYKEDIVFESLGQPLFNYSSTSFHPETNKPMHLERGFLRVNPGTNNLAFMVAHNFGLTMVEEGVFDPTAQEIRLDAQKINRMSFAKDPEVKGLKRSFKLNADGCLEVTIDMATSNTEMTNHLLVTYKKQ